MTTYNDILKDVKVRYRHTFTDDRIMVWLNESIREIYEVMELDSIPYLIQTIWHEHFYNLPDNMDVTKIKTVTCQLNDQSEVYTEIPFMRVDDMQFADVNTHWYSIVGGMFYVNIPSEILDNTPILIFCDSFIDTITVDNLNDPVALPTKYQEILKLGILERIAAARKDIVMKNNYSVEKEEKITEYAWQTKLAEPEWTRPIDVMPRAGNHGYRWW